MEASKRIDKGIKRGPRKPPTAITNKTSIITHVQRGGLLSQIARELGVTPAAISQQLAKDPEYRAARQNGAQARLDQQYENLESADDALKLARARETFRAAAWFAEREFPEQWGQTNKLQVTNEPLSDVDRALLGDASALLHVFREKIIEAEPLPSLPVDKSEKQD